MFLRLLLFVFLVTGPAALPAAEVIKVAPFDEPLVDLHDVDPTIEVDLRYASKQNLARRPLYPPGTRAFVRVSVAQRLALAQTFLKERGYRLKIWDAYRPPEVQALLWQLAPNESFVADPAAGRGSLHGWGVAVDATMVDAEGNNAHMPTDFDDFTPAAFMHYKGGDALVRYNLRLLQSAMARAGFLGLRTEWWHFTVRNWQEFGPVAAAPKPPSLLERILPIRRATPVYVPRTPVQPSPGRRATPPPRKAR